MLTGLQIVGSEGLPISIQIAALPFEDEKVLRVLREVQESCACKKGDEMVLKHASAAKERKME